jgi:hypothetical protein
LPAYTMNVLPFTLTEAMHSKSAEFAAYYYNLTGERVCTTCMDKIYNKYIELKQLLREGKKFIPMSERKYILKEGVLIDTFNSDKAPKGHFTNKNMTDEIAEQIISAHPKYKEYFIIQIKDSDFVKPATEKSFNKKRRK